jgi:hypothetical protein
MRIAGMILVLCFILIPYLPAEDEYDEPEVEKAAFLMLGGGWNHDTGMTPPQGMIYNDKFFAFARLGGFIAPVAALYFEPSYAMLEAVPAAGRREKTFEHFLIINPGISLKPPAWHRIYPRVDAGYDFVYHTIEGIRPNLQDHGFNIRGALVVNPDVFLFEISINYLLTFTGGEHAVKLMQVGGGAGELY